MDECQHQGDPRDQLTLTSHTNLVTWILDHVEMGEMISGQKVIS